MSRDIVGIIMCYEYNYMCLCGEKCSSKWGLLLLPYVRPCMVRSGTISIVALFYMVCIICVSDWCVEFGHEISYWYKSGDQ